MRLVKVCDAIMGSGKTEAAITYIKNTNKKALREYQMTVAELQLLSPDDLSNEQSDFLKYYEYRMPVGQSDCVMNKICRVFEANFDGYIARNGGNESFDYQIMKNGQEYTPRQFNAIKRLYNEYNKRLKIYSVFTDYEKIDKMLTLLSRVIKSETTTSKKLSIRKL